jgi:hypothetical protein
VPARDEQAYNSSEEFIAFRGVERVAIGDLVTVAAAAWQAHYAGSDRAVLVFKRSTGEVIDLDLRGTEQDVVARHLRPHSPPKRGRPSLGVVPREITLLPRHWEWLARQPGGASTTLRRLVDAARKADVAVARERTAAAYRFLSAIGGDLVGFEELARALFAQDRDGLNVLLQQWPPDLREAVIWLLDGPTLQRESS